MERWDIFVGIVFWMLDRSWKEVLVGIGIVFCLIEVFVWWRIIVEDFSLGVELLVRVSLLEWYV